MEILIGTRAKLSCAQSYRNTSLDGEHPPCIYSMLGTTVVPWLSGVAWSHFLARIGDADDNHGSPVLKVVRAFRKSTNIVHEKAGSTNAAEFKFQVNSRAA